MRNDVRSVVRRGWSQTAREPGSLRLPSRAPGTAVRFWKKGSKTLLLVREETLRLERAVIGKVTRPRMTAGRERVTAQGTQRLDISFVSWTSAWPLRSIGNSLVPVGAPSTAVGGFIVQDKQALRLVMTVGMASAHVQSQARLALRSSRGSAGRRERIARQR